MNDASYKPAPSRLPELPNVKGDPLGYYKLLGFALKHSAVPPHDAALFGQSERIGLTKEGFDESKLTPPQRTGLLRALEDGPAAAVSAIAAARIDRSGWTWGANQDNPGFHYPYRTLLAGLYMAGNGEKEALYPIRYTDSKGELLTGEKRFVIRFKKAPPVEAFWSVTIYDASTILLVPNSIQRYKVGIDTKGLKINDDGSFDIYVQHEQPAGDKASNWCLLRKGRTTCYCVAINRGRNCFQERMSFLR
jgi:hypothetical protein